MALQGVERGVELAPLGLQLIARLRHEMGGRLLGIPGIAQSLLEARDRGAQVIDQPLQARPLGRLIVQPIDLRAGQIACY